MARPVRTIIVFLVLGMIANVALAWAAAAWPVGTSRAGRWSYEAPPDDPLQRGWRLTIDRSLGMTRVFAESRPVARGAAPTLMERYSPWWCGLPEALTATLVGGPMNRRSWRGDEPNYPLAMIEDGAGWPLVSWRCRWTTRNLSRDTWRTAELEGWIVLPRLRAPGRSAMATVSRALPYQPVTTGVVVNSMVLGAVLWVLVSLPFAMRRLIRLDRGRCPACTYPIGTSPVCTECGAVIPETYRRPPGR